MNIYYARIRAGKIERVDGTQIGSLDDPITPGEGDHVYDPTEPTWVHDVAADSSGRPVIVFATFPTAADHRYFYARWTGSAWDVHQITPAGGSIREDGGSPYYSGGLTLDHEDPSRVYLSRQVGSSWQVETWTTSDGRDELVLVGGHDRAGQERAPGLAARHERHRRRHERDLDERQLSELGGLPDSGSRADVRRRQRAADRRRRAGRARRPCAARGALRRGRVA